MKCVIPLYSGIGNVIQMLPFAFEMRRRYSEVAAYIIHLDFPKATKNIVKGIFSKIFSSRRKIPRGYKIFREYCRKPIPEFKTWFLLNKEKLPESYKIDFINYRKTHMKYNVILCPDCKTNWPCKNWPYWADLATHFKNLLIVGRDKRQKILNGGDARGKLSILQIGGLIKNANIFIGSDSGLSHYSAALGTKTYIIYGATDPIKNMPPENAIKVSKNLSCQPCQYRRKMLKKGDKILGCKERRCLMELTPNEVIEAIK